MKRSIVPIILCGGIGSRLWPESRHDHPKHFLKFGNDGKSLIEETLERFDDSKELDIDNPIIVTNESHSHLIKQILLSIKKTSKIIEEPSPKNTAPAVTLAALECMNKDEDELMLISPADHLIADRSEFHEAIKRGIDCINSNLADFILFGIHPHKPHSGYGYIEVEEDLNSILDLFPVSSFVEKPSLELAEQLIKNHNYYWNTGIFLFKAKTWISLIQTLSPEIFEAVNLSFSANIRENKKNLTIIKPDKEKFNSCAEQSVDYAVVERFQDAQLNLNMVRLNSQWSDVGSWESLWEVSNKDKDGNNVNGNIQLMNCKNSLVHANDRLVSVLGLENIAVIDTPDALLVSSINNSEKVKDLLELLNKEGHQETKFHRKTFRPWGWYDNIEEGDFFKVKRIHVYPQQSLSLQKHSKRSEHWVVIKGSPEITIDNKSFVLQENESTFIPVGSVHRLVNSTDKYVEIIEVQYGSYLGEDDIVRLEDIYGRA